MIDQTRIDELAEDFGLEDLGELIATFLEECEGVVTTLGTLKDTGDMQARSDHFHLLKGCARNIGANRLGDLCETFEEAPESFCGADHQHLEAELTSIRSFFGEMFGKAA